MRKTCLLVAFVIASSVFANGQTPTPLTVVMPSMSGIKSITAQNVEGTVGSNSVRFRGDVRMVGDTVTITADEADAVAGPNRSYEFDLRGNVHVTVNQPTR